MIKIAFVFISLMILSGCNTESKFHGKDDFRRFCFALPRGDAGSLELPEGLTINAFVNDTMVFVIIDVDVGMDFEALQNEIAMSISDVYPKPGLLEKISSGDVMPLERIYELEQVRVYSPKEGQLKQNPTGEYQRSVFCMELYPGPASIEKYKEIHGIGQVWPEITSNMKKSGILDMEIYIMGNLTFLISDNSTETDTEVHDSNMIETLREQEWQNYVSQFQKTNPVTGEKWVPMSRIY